MNFISIRQSSVSVKGSEKEGRVSQIHFFNALLILLLTYLTLSNTAIALPN